MSEMTRDTIKMNDLKNIELHVTEKLLFETLAGTFTDNVIRR